MLEKDGHTKNGMADVTKILQVIQKNFEQIRASCLEEGTSSHEEDSQNTPTTETDRSDREYMEWKNWRERENLKGWK